MSRIWTRIAVSISCDGNHFTMNYIYLSNIGYIYPHEYALASTKSIALWENTMLTKRIQQWNVIYEQNNYV